jgi:hypothetical protein
MAWARRCLMGCCLPARVFFRSLLEGIRSCLGSPRRDEAHQRKCSGPFRHMASRLGRVKRELRRGATFRFTLPVDANEPNGSTFDGAVAPSAGPSDIGPRSYMFSDDRFPCSYRLERDATTIVVGDEEEPVRKALDRLQRASGFATEVVASGAEFVATPGDVPSRVRGPRSAHARSRWTAVRRRQHSGARITTYQIT